MEARVVILDYGMGNLRSVQKALERVGCPARVTAEPREVRDAHAVVLPGVGAFARAMEHLEAGGLADAVREAVAAGKPLLGICLGLQLLFEASEETVGYRGPEGTLPRGLGLLGGTVRRFPAGLKVPQMGWNRLEILQPEPLFRGVPQGAYAYFLHSFYADPADPGVVAARAVYGVPFAAAVQREPLLAIQFHPEKSGHVGLRILANFLRFALGERAVGPAGGPLAVAGERP